MLHLPYIGLVWGKADENFGTLVIQSMLNGEFFFQILIHFNSVIWQDVGLCLDCRYVGSRNVWACIYSALQLARANVNFMCMCVCVYRGVLLETSRYSALKRRER